MPTRKTPTKPKTTTTTRRRRTTTPRAKATPATKAKSGKLGTTGIAAIALAGTAAAGAALFGLVRFLRRPSEGTVPTDLMKGEHPDGSTRAIEEFRPDPTAPVLAAKREALRPALVNGAAH